MYGQETWAGDACGRGVNTADDHYHDDDEYKGQPSLILKWLYTALNTKMDTNSETKKGEEVLVLRENG